MCLAVIGAGAIANEFYLPALQSKRDEIDEILVVDKKKERAALLARKVKSAKVATNYEEVLTGVDGVIIALPDHLHYQAVKKSLNTGNHVLCEKPLAQSRENATSLVRVSTKKDKSLLVNNTRRIYPNFRKIRRLIKGGEIGEPIEIRWIEGEQLSWPSKSGYYFDGDNGSGIINDRGAHVLDLLNWWFDESIEIEACRDDAMGGVEAYADIFLKGSQGLSGHITLNWLGRLSNECYIKGSKGSIYFEPYGWKKFSIETDDYSKIQRPGSHINEYSQFGEALVSNLIDILNGRGSPIVRGEEVVESLELINNCYNVREPIQRPWLEPYNEFTK
jgi:predicted dehydrogenase